MSYLSTTVNWDSIRAITHPKVSRKIADNITGKIPLLYFLNKQGNKEYESGGFNYVLPVFKELQNAQAYAGATVLSDAEADPATVAIYERKQLTVPIVATGTKMLQNSGNNPEAIVDYMTFLVEAAEESMKNSMDGSTVGIFSSNTETDLGITGLQNIVSTTPTSGTTGGLSRSTYSWWQNQSATITTSFASTGLAGLRNAFYSAVRGDESPQIGMFTQAAYINLHTALTSTIYYNVSQSPRNMDGDIPFQHIYFQGVPIMFGSNVPANTQYLLNTKYLKLMVHQDRDMTIRDWITPVAGDYLLARLYWAGNLVCSNLARQAVIINGDT